MAVGDRISAVLIGFTLAMAITFSPTGAAAQDRVLQFQSNDSHILIVHMERILREAQAAQKVKAQAEDVRASLRNELGARNAALKTEEETLVTLRPTLDKDKFDERVRKFEESVRSVRRETQDRGSELQRAVAKAQQRLRAALRPILIEIMRERQAQVLLDESQVIFSVTALDITDEALARLDKTTPTVELTLPTLSSDAAPRETTPGDAPSSDTAPVQ